MLNSVEHCFGRFHGGSYVEHCGALVWMCSMRSHVEHCGALVWMCSMRTHVEHWFGCVP